MTAGSPRASEGARGLPPGTELRPLRAEDLPRIVGLETALFGGEAWSPELLTRELAAANAPVPDRRYVVVEATAAAGAANADSGMDARAGEILGYAGLWFGDGRGDADLLSIATVPAARRRGVASAMLGHLLDVARRAGCRAVLLEVRASNAAARALYERFGFQTIGTRRRYYLAPVEDAAVMRLGLSGSIAPGPVGTERL